MLNEEHGCDLCGKYTNQYIFMFKLYFEDNIEKPLFRLCDDCRDGFDLKCNFTIENEDTGDIENCYDLYLMG